LAVGEPLFKSQKFLGVVLRHAIILTLEDMAGSFVGKKAAWAVGSCQGSTDHHHFPHRRVATEELGCPQVEHGRERSHGTLEGGPVHCVES